MYAPPISRRDAGITRPPLSFAQQSLWFVQQLEPKNAAYNIPLTVRMSGPLNVATLERALNEVVRRHEILRTAFIDVDGQPAQVISSPQHVSLTVVDLRERSEQDQAEELVQHRRCEAETHFDLAAGPLWRAKLLRLGNEEHIALFTMHHVITDGWSMGLLINELGNLYEAFSAGRPSPLEELPVQYADYTVWQREWLRGEVLQSQLDYWRRQLADAPAHLELPTARPQTGNRTTAGAIHNFTVPRDIFVRLHEIMRSEQATLSMLMLAAFASLLSRYSGQEDILIGMANTGRQRLELERLIGFFLNMLVMRIDLSGNPDFRALLRRVRQTTLAAYAHQDLPFEMLVSELQPGRSLSHNPLFQTSLVIQNAPRPDSSLKDLRIEELEPDKVAAKFDLTLVVAEFDGGLAGTFVYSTDLFDDATIAGMVESLQQILRAATGTTPAEQQGESLSAFNAELD